LDSVDIENRPVAYIVANNLRETNGCMIQYTATHWNLQTMKHGTKRTHFQPNLMSKNTASVLPLPALHPNEARKTSTKRPTQAIPLCRDFPFG